MPSNCGGEECHQYLCPPIFVDHGKDAVADCEPDHQDGIDFDAQRDCAVDAEVLDILAEYSMVDKPIIQAFRRAQPQRSGEEQQRGCRQQRQEDSRHGKRKRERSEYSQNYFHGTNIQNSNKLCIFVALINIVALFVV